MFAKLAIGLLLATAHSVAGKAKSCKANRSATNGTDTSAPHTNGTLTNSTGVVIHDGSFHPDFYLSVTYELQNVACGQRMSVLVNGTSPGPELRLPGGKTSWVRVCNNMDEYNTTMV
jgi:L-ascorbate oxidase